MIKRIALILCFLIVDASNPEQTSARTRSFGGTFSYAGVGLGYAQEVDSGNFTEFQLRLEPQSMLLSNGHKPGMSVSAFWNIVFTELESRNGNKLRLYAGPGFSAGYGHDRDDPPGFFAGLKGRVGGECSFPRRITLACNITPMIGGYFNKKGGMINMNFYRRGLLYGAFPEICIRYEF